MSLESGGEATCILSTTYGVDPEPRDWMMEAIPDFAQFWHKHRQYWLSGCTYWKGILIVGMYLLERYSLMIVLSHRKERHQDLARPSNQPRFKHIGKTICDKNKVANCVTDRVARWTILHGLLLGVGYRPRPDGRTNPAGVLDGERENGWLVEELQTEVCIASLSALLPVTLYSDHVNPPNSYILYVTKV
jgi:hypothetical protein